MACDHVVQGHLLTFTPTADSDIYDVPSEEVGVFGQMEGVDFMGMVDLLDDHSGLGPYLAAELFDTAMFDSLTMP